MEIRVGTNIEGRAVKYYKNATTTPDYKLMESKSLLKERATTDIWRGIDNKSLASQISSKVKLGLQAYEDDLNVKRDRLKSLLDEEEQSFSELSLNPLQGRNTDTKKCENVEEDVICPNKEEDEHLAKMKLQLDIAKCKEIQPMLAKRREIETRQMQELQMKEKQAIQMQEKDMNKLWHTVMTKDVETRNALCESEKAGRLQNELILKKYLESQIKTCKELKKTEHLTEKEKEQQRAIEHDQKIEELNLEEKIKKNKIKSTLSENLMKQIDEKKKIVQKIKQQEIELEKSLSSLSNQKYDEDLKKKLAIKKHIRQEIDLFNKHLSGVKSNLDIQNRNDEKYFESMAQKQLENEDYHRNLLHCKRKELLQNAISGRDIQMEEKKIQAELAKHQAREELERRMQIENKISQENNLDIQNDIQTKFTYKRDLENQMQAEKIAKEKEDLRQQTEANAKMEEDQKIKEKCMELMKREFKTESTHPFTKIIKKSAQPKDTWYPYLPETKYTKY